ncbi:MAG TPA: serine/threonine-protein kinase [Candidatus Dormibacteraeota bacterium]|nr:serine/threonine-protein kinase [Candidatus Dormibacteraeota bacterium]
MTSLPDPDRWPVIAPILAEALDLPPEQRAPFLDRACAGDSALRREIEELLRADERAGDFLGAPVDLTGVAVPDDDGAGGDPPSASGSTIGPYRVVREIGRGGMGVVYEAEQKSPRRPVALKVILGGRHVDAEAVRMFRRETDSLARLKHPSIAAIYESGSTGEGQHFFAMELVQGRSLSEYLDERGPARSRSDVRLRLALFRKICAAVAYAHQRGVIHLDLKPSNILVLEAPGGEVPEIKVLDFGLARITDPDAQGATAVTAFGRVQGTLPYMSPEQVRGRRDEVDVRSDVYALGVILYRMLTGRLPYDLEGLEITEAARIVCEEAPLPLGSAAGSGARFDHDLTVIVNKALEKEPGRRYPGVAALDEDVARYLDGRPILARPPSAAYLIRTLVARHKIPVAAAGALLVLLVGFAIAMTLQARRIATERDRANREATTAERVSDFLTGLFKVSDPDETRGNSIKVREILDSGLEKIGKELADEPEVQARLMQTMGKVYANLGLYPKALPILEQSVATRRRLLGDEHPDTLAAMYDLALLYVNLGRRAEAEKLDDRILETRRRLLGEEHPETLCVMAGLALIDRLQGRFEQAERLERQVLEVRRRVLGEDHPDTLDSMVDLAGVYYEERRYADAEMLYRTAIEKIRRVLGEENSVTLRNITSLANVYERQGRYAEAEALHRDSRERLRRLLGDDHPLTFKATNDLAVLLDDRGRYADAEPLYRDNLERERRVLGEDHPSTLTSMNNLANVYSSEGRYTEAEALFRESLERGRRVLGENHPDTTNTLYNLGCMSVLRGNRTSALDWLGQAVAHGYSHWEVMAKDSDLKPLRGTPAFDALVARARENSRKESPSTAGTSPASSASPAGRYR